MPLSSLKTSVTDSRDYLDLFPYRFNFIEAEFPAPDARPKWTTENRYPLHDRLIIQGSKLYGVSFGSKTKYLMIDLDRRSQYHPQNDSQAIPRLLSALEDLGLTRFVAIQSSYSGGVHLYFPFEEERSSFWLASAVYGLLCATGLPPHDGQLEIFPNPKAYDAGFKPHRLPLQQGSYLLNDDFEAIYGDRQDFVKRWKLAVQGNEIASEEKLKMVAQEHDRTHHPRHLKGKKAKFYADLQAEILPGWSGPGQTNQILGRIAIREYVFGGLTGKALATSIAQVAISLPGFEEWCSHSERAEILKRAKEWARSVERSPRYYPATKSRPKTIEVEPANKPEKKKITNEVRAQEAQEKIKKAVADLAAEGKLPKETVQRSRLLVKKIKSSLQTLYKYKNLWHPEYLSADPTPTEATQEEKTDLQTANQRTEEIFVPVDDETRTESEIHPEAPNKVYSAVAEGGDPQVAPFQPPASEKNGGGTGGDNPPKDAKFVAEIIQKISLENKAKAKARITSEEVPVDETYFERFKRIGILDVPEEIEEEEKPKPTLPKSVADEIFFARFRRIGILDLPEEIREEEERNPPQPPD